MTANRVARALLATGLAGALALTAAPPAFAANGGSATAEAAYGSAATIEPSTPQGTGLIGATVAVVLQPLIDALTQTVSSVVSTAVLGLLNSPGNIASTTPGYPSAYPASPLPPLDVPGVLTLSLGGPHGAVTSGASGYSATSQFANAQLSLLGLSVADVGAATASATCPATSPPTATAQLAGVSLLNGAVRAKLANGDSVLQVSLAGGPYLPITSLGANLTRVAGTSVSVRANGRLLQATIAVSLDQLLGALGLTALLSSLSGIVDTSGTALALSVTIGPGASTASGTDATAWGLEIGADLSGTVSVSVLSILGGLTGGATITIPSGIRGTSYGNLLDLKLGYATCTSGTTPLPGAHTPAVPPALI